MPLAAVTALSAAAGINFGYPLQPVWLFFAVLGLVLTLIAAAVCLGRDLRSSPVGWSADMLPVGTRPQEAVAYYRGLLRRFGRVSVHRPAGDPDPPDPTAPLAEIVSGVAVPAYGVVISRQGRRLLATTAYGG